MRLPTRFPLGELLVSEMNRNYLYFVQRIDLTAIDDKRAIEKSSYTAFVVQAVAQTLAQAEHQDLNCMVRRRIFTHDRVLLDDITATVAVERPDGLVLAVPIRGADRKSLPQIHTELRAMTTGPVDNSREVRHLDLLNTLARYAPPIAKMLTLLPCYSKAIWQATRHGAFVGTSPAQYGTPDQLFSVWPWPMTVGFGTVKRRPVVVNGQVVARNTLDLTVAVD